MVGRSSGWRFLALAVGFSGLSADLAGAACAGEPAHLEAQPAIAASEAKTRCAPALVKAGEACKVDAFARLGAVAGHDFSYALNEFALAPDEPLPYRRVIIFEGRPAAMLRPVVISGGDPAFLYDAPKVLHSSGHVLLRIPGSEDGTGNSNREMLHVWAKAGWRDVDVTSWLGELRGYLPKGLGVQQGVYPDHATMTVETRCGMTA